MWGLHSALQRTQVPQRRCTVRKEPCDWANYCAASLCSVRFFPYIRGANYKFTPPLPHSRVLVLLATKQEWGNPNEHKFHEYMLSYSPYDNVRQQPYPAMLVTGGLNDPRVSYVALSSTCFGMRIFIFLFFVYFFSF